MASTRQDADREETVEGSVSYVVRELESFIGELVHGRAVAYIGAGVSMSANLISWGELLGGLQKEAKDRLANDDLVTREYFRKLTSLERSLEVGDWLLAILGPDEFSRTLEKLISLDRDQKRPRPSPVHQHLTRLPFSMAVTTNYDQLLEHAYKAAEIEIGSALTWCDAQEILAAVKAAKFKVIHAHGLLDKPGSLVLSASQYAKQQNSRPQTDHISQLRFGDVFKWLLKTKTFLFLGASLQDPDLLFHLQEVRAEQGEFAPRHYALLPFDEAPRRRREILERNLNVTVISVGSGEMKSASNGWLTDLIAGVLRDLSARVAVRSFEQGLARFPTSDDTCFCLGAALQSLLDEAVKITGSFRGDFCLPERPGSHGSGVLKYTIFTDKTDREIQQHPQVPPNSICGIAYYQATAERGVYVTDVDHEAIHPSSRLGHYGEVRYKVGHPEVKSELAMPIEADGVRVGVLNLESTLLDAYGAEHLEAARRFAEKAGRLYAAAIERQRQARRLHPERTEPAYRDMKGICERLWGIARGVKPGELEVALLIYHADYQSGLLKSQNPIGTVLPKGTDKHVTTPEFSFADECSKDKSLAARIYYSRLPRAYADAKEAIRQRKLPADSYPEQLGIRGPLIGFPISIHGHVSGVVVSWLRKASVTELDGRDVELFRRAAHVMSNCFQFEREKGLAQPDQRFASVEMVEEILDSVTAPPITDAAEREDLLNEIGQFYRAEIGGAMIDFLHVLKKREQVFAQKMADWYGNSQRPTFWISPARCRCWIRCGESLTGKPRFLLALQAAINGAPAYKNEFKFKGKRYGVAMQPLRSAPRNESKRTRRGAAEETGKNQRPRTDNIQVHINGREHQVKSRIFDDNSYLSFLLSRVSAYPFAFQQKPRIMGRDIMSEILEKDPSLPWLVSPLLVNRSADWADCDDAGGSNGVPETRLAGYLTFDNGWHDIRKPGVGELLSDSEVVGVADQWASFQNDLIHQTALFGACLAQKNCFSELLP